MLLGRGPEDQQHDLLFVILCQRMFIIERKLLVKRPSGIIFILLIYSFNTSPFHSLDYMNVVMKAHVLDVGIIPSILVIFVLVHSLHIIL